MRRSPFLDLPGAVESRDSGVAAHYGNPLSEQRLLRSGAIVDLSHRGVVAVTGPDRLSWLNSVFSQEIGSLSPGVSVESLLLGASGRVEQAIRLADDGVTTWLLVDSEHTAALVAWLERMRFMLRVEVADRTEDFGVVGWLEPDAVREDIPAVLVWSDPWRRVAAGGVQYASLDAHPGSGWTWHEALVPRSVLDSLAEAVRGGSLSVAGQLARNALRVEAWRPELPDEGDDLLLPHEVDWLRSAVHLSKGCYRGQETVAKVHNLGHPPRRLTFLHLDGSESVLPERGAIVRDNTGREAGTITSSALHHELGPIALALLKRNTGADEHLTVDADGTLVAAAQEVIVPADAGSAVQVPRLPRLGQRRR